VFRGDDMPAPWAVQFYNSQAWRSLRRVALKRDGYTCRDCGGRADEVHHTITLTQGNIHDKSISLNLDLLVSLCHDCHTRITKRGDDGLRFDADGYLQAGGVREW